MALLLSRRQAPQFKWRPTIFQQGDTFTLPAPYGGINLRDDINALKPNEARVLENWLPGTGELEFRPGKVFHAGGMGLLEVKTLAGFVGFTTSTLIAGANGKLYDVTGGTTEFGNDTYTKVLLKFDGADASTTITDSNAGGSSHTWAAAGNAQIDTAQSKFGGSSLVCDGTGDWVTTNDHADFTIGTSSVTIKGWARPDTDGAVIRFAGQADSGLAAATSAWYMARNASNKFEFHVSNGASFTTLTSTTSVVAGAWFHIEAVIDTTTDTAYLFVNGALEASTTFTGTVPDVSVALRVGAAGESTTTPWSGWIDEFAIDVGVARHTAAFTAPTLPYAPFELATGFSQDRWQTALYSDRLFFVNGTDNPQVYNGSTIAGIVWTGSGLTDNNLVNIALVRNRLWFCEVNSADVWYGNVGQITAASALTKFQLSQIASGGICTAIGSWSVTDSGDGADDLTVFVMSTGEIIVYQGDPSTTFALVGKYQGAPPIGRQCLFKMGGELVVITRQGYLPVSAAVKQPAGKVLVIASVEPWGKVAPGVAADAALDADNAGWHAVLHLGVVYGNVPQTVGSVSKQWVLNTRGTNGGAWSLYTGWNGSSFVSFASTLYFGAQSGGKVYSATGATDDGAAITTTARGAFKYPSGSRRDNVFTAARPVIKASGSVTGRIGVDTDFVATPLTGEAVPFLEGTGTTLWGSPWGSAWSTSPTIDPQWHSIYGDGSAVAVKTVVQSSAGDVTWSSTDIAFKPGGAR